MATDQTNDMTTQTVDLTGLPEAVVQDIQRLVQTLRIKFGSGTAASPTGVRQPLRGLFAEPGLSISKEEIDEAQREAWAAFPRDFPEPPKKS